jgi:hypothetical protein
VGALGSWFAAQTRTALWASAGLVVLGTVFLVLGLTAGNSGGWLADDGYALNLIATLTTAPYGLAVLTLVYSGVTAEQENRRSRNEARAVAGRLVGDMMDTLLTPFSERAGLTADRRLRSVQITSQLNDLRAHLVNVVETAHRLRMGGLHRSAARAERNAELDRLDGQIGAAREAWASILQPEHDSVTWRHLAYQWGVIEGDVRTRLIAADEWIANEAAVRMTELIRDPGTLFSATVIDPFVSGLDVQIDPEADDHFVVAYAEDKSPEASQSDGFRLFDSAALEMIGDVAKVSQQYVERLMLLMVQLSDLGVMYWPPSANGLRSVSGSGISTATLGRLSGRPVPEQLGTDMANLLGRGENGRG